MIRIAGPGDKLRIVEMAARFLISSQYGEWLPSTPEQIGAMVDLVMQVGVIFVAEIPVRDRHLDTAGKIHGHDEIVGMLALALEKHIMTGQLCAKELAWWVEPEHRGGLGVKLHKAVEEWAEACSVHMLEMLSPTGSDLGVYYARQGYVEVETSWMKRL